MNRPTGEPTGKSLPPSYFDLIYERNEDPWDFESSAYERAKYAATLAALPKERYRSAFEIGCSIGVLTAELALRCDRLLAVDVSETALAKARSRCRYLPQVRFRTMQVPAKFPRGPFDLILISEVGYYLSAADWRRATDLVVARLTPTGHAVLVHWTPRVHDYPQTGNEVHERFRRRAPRPLLRHLREQREETYRLDVYERV